MTTVEDAFLKWAAAGQVSAADLDAAIWRLLSTLGQLGPGKDGGRASNFRRV